MQINDRAVLDDHDGRAWRIGPIPSRKELVNHIDAHGHGTGAVEDVVATNADLDKEVLTATLREAMLGGRTRSLVAPDAGVTLLLPVGPYWRSATAAGRPHSASKI